MMLRMIAAAASLCSLAACGPQPGISTHVPAALARTVTDDVTLEAAWKAFDVALDAINLLGDQGVIVPGTPRGQAVAAGIRKVHGALAAAERFAAAGSASDYRAALQEATAGMAELRVAMARK